MTIYITHHPSTLLSFYLQSRNISFSTHIVSDITHFNDICSTGPSLNNQLNLSPSIHLVIPSSNSIFKSLSSLSHSLGNDTYISNIEDKKVWNKLKKKYEWIKTLDLDLKEYNKSIERLKKCLTNDGYKWFKDKYYIYPLKVHQEMIHLISKAKSLNRKLNIEDLKSIYGIVDYYKFYEYINNLGDLEKCTKLINAFDQKTIWLGFIGMNKPYIYEALLNKYPITYQHLWVLIDTFIQLIRSSRMNINPGVYIINYMLNKVIMDKFNPQTVQGFLNTLQYM